MAVDLSVFQRQKTKLDYDREAEQFNLRKQALQAKLNQASRLDAGRLGEEAFLKAAQGLPLSPVELAAAKLMDAKSGGIQFDPVTGGVVQKPRISDKIGLPGVTPGGNPSLGAGGGGFNMGGVTIPPVTSGQMGGGYSPQENVPAPASPVNEFEAAFQQQMAAARGNPKLQQELKAAYAKDKLKYDESQAKAAGFSDRISLSNPVFEDPKAVEEGSSLLQQGLGSIPVIGNKLTSKDYQRFSQAERDFINAQLRRESGAAIAPSEFQNARLQYIPQPGDSKEVLAQKAASRAAVAQGLQRSAGPAYMPPAMPPKIDIQSLPSDPSVPASGIDLYSESKKRFDLSKKQPVSYKDYFK